VGWPAKKNRYDVRQRQCNFSGCYHIQAPGAPREKVQFVDGNPDVHFAVEMNKRKDFIDAPTQKRVNLPALHGVSGGGVWSMRPEHNHLYPACARALAGIIIEDWESKSLAKAIRAEPIWALPQSSRGLSRRPCHTANATLRDPRNLRPNICDAKEEAERILVPSPPGSLVARPVSFPTCG
jgi:hypothetical protein